jgi:homoserine dehydrogenase
MRISLLLAGFGHVARRFAGLLDEQRAALAALGIEPVIAGIVSRRGGSVFDSRGIDVQDVLARAQAGAPMGSAWTASTADWIARHVPRLDRCPVVVETTTLDVRDGEPAISHVRAALSAGAHVLTANKGPVAFAARELQRDAASRGLSFLFEGAVMDGIPIFSLVRETCATVELRGFRGVLNSTTNYMLTAMEQGEPYASALGRMQAEGVAEADPSLDVDGWDAAAKTAALANVWFDAGMTPHDVAREGLDDSTVARAVDAYTRGRRLKLVCSATRDDSGRANAAVTLQELEASDPLANLDGQANALELDTWPLGRFVITQRDGGLEKTAQALVGDVATIARRLRR